MHDQQKIYKRCLGDFSRYLREYTSQAKEIATARNVLSEEYNRAENSIADKKFKKMMGEKSAWELDETLLKQSGLERDIVYGNPEVARRFMFAEVG